MKMVFRRPPLMAAALLLGILICAPLPKAALAQEKPPAPVVVVIDAQTVLRESSAAKSAREQRDKYLQQYQTELSKEENALREGERELARQKTVLSPEAFETARRDFERKVGEFQRKVQERRRALEESFGVAMAEVEKNLIKVTDEIAQERGANLVLVKSQVFLFDLKMDITKQALDRVNARLPKVDFPAPKLQQAQGQGKATGKK